MLEAVWGISFSVWKISPMDKGILQRKGRCLKEGAEDEPFCDYRPCDQILWGVFGS